MVGLDIFVVLYKRELAQSDTLVTLSQINFAALGFQVDVHIWDNSPEPIPVATGSLPFRWFYTASGSNVALSKVYNTLLRRSRRAYVMILDQDSRVGVALFRELAEALKQVRVDVFVPVIKHDDHVISPGRLLWIKGSALRSLQPGSFLPPTFTAMMSGLCFTRACFARFGPRPFDERLRFYGIDTRFCRDLAKRGGRAYLYDAVLGHDSALRSTTDHRAALERKIWLWQSWLRVFDRNLAEVIAIRCYVLWKIVQASRHSGAFRGFREVFTEVFQ